MSLAVKEKNHVRLVFLGAAGVGKTALIRRFLMDTFEPKHRRTVEELHSKEYEVSGATVKVEILDTSGSYSFPAMRKLSIQNSDAFALVYAVDDAESFESVKSLREEILEVKEDKFPPIVVVGNKAESGSERQVPAEANLPSRVSPALCKRRETLPKEQALRPPMNKTNSCSVC
ncbi:GTP-binding protein Rhes-like [Egretta garzetta]|uniref:GTP-binding protein Rhes n=1 Tax=Egretta garzetta TaxID=188379 RepID=A0A091J248_EGRGA|nr:GTP-binding protein Rhes-like [Egretta garzetta]KFP15044.1 GTP-binding protein Rhes [Egretta garzetta]